MEDIKVKQQLENAAVGDTVTINCVDIAAIPPALSDDDEYAYAEQVRARIRGLCAKYGVYSLELDLDGPGENAIDFRKISVSAS